jgi:hypothetical protein
MDVSTIGLDIAKSVFWVPILKQQALWLFADV